MFYCTASFTVKKKKKKIATSQGNSSSKIGLLKKGKQNSEESGNHRLEND